MNERHQLAINYFLQGMNKKEALQKAGYKYSAERPTAVFNIPEVKAELERRMKEMVDRANISEDWIVDKLVTIINAEVGEVVKVVDGKLTVDYSLLSDNTRKAISDISVEEYKSGRGAGAVPVTKVKVKMDDRLRALELLMRYKGMFKDRVEVSVEEGVLERLQKARNRVQVTEE